MKLGNLWWNFLLFVQLNTDRYHQLWHITIFYYSPNTHSAYTIYTIHHQPPSIQPPTNPTPPILVYFCFIQSLVALVGCSFIQPVTSKEWGFCPFLFLHFRPISSFPFVRAVCMLLCTLSTNTQQVVKVKSEFCTYLYTYIWVVSVRQCICDV